MLISRVILVLAVFAILGGTKGAVQAQSQPPEFKTMTLAPTKFHEECLELSVGQTVHYVFDSSRPIDFNIHYHQGHEVTYPVKHQKISKATDKFVAPIAQVYCLMWSNPNSTPMTLNYSFQVR